MAERLCLAERARIEALTDAGTKPDEIARLIGRDRSTVYRELDRGRRRGVYRSETAQQLAERRARRPRVGKLEADPVLAGQVKRRLELCWSPHAISAGLADGGDRVCAETIYRCVYSGGCLGGDAWKRLPRQQRCRRPRSRRSDKASPLGQYRPLCDRPAAAGDRCEPGHWEGDLIVGKANKTAATTLVERVSRHTLVVPLPDGCSAPAVAGAVTAALGRQPAHLVRTLTWDQGREMARWADIETALGIEVYFCEPHSPWQRPSNEHTNAMLRRWLPKGTPLDHNPLRLSIIEDSLNTSARWPAATRTRWP